MRADVGKAMNMMEEKKTAGPGSIILETIKAFKEFGVNKITEIYYDIYELEYIHQEMKHTVFGTTKKAKATDCSCFRTISLMSLVTKILLKVILERARKQN